MAALSSTSAALEVAGREPLLFTPGPLTTSAPVKLAMLQDLGSRDARFIGVVDNIRNGLLDMAGVSKEGGYECVLMQGSGTFAVESTVGSVIPKDGKLLVLSNGAYGKRIGQMAEIYDIDHHVIQYGEREVPRVEDMLAYIAENPDTTHVAMIHHETTTGSLGPMGDMGRALKEARPDIPFIVDSMSGFGAYPVDMVKDNVAYLVSSSNKVRVCARVRACVCDGRFLSESSCPCPCPYSDLDPPPTHYRMLYPLLHHLPKPCSVSRVFRASRTVWRIVPCWTRPQRLARRGPCR